MDLRDQDLYSSLGELEWKAFRDLHDLSDYIWKAPRLLTHEKALEERKLATYFADGGTGAEARKRFQSKRLNETFPRLIAVGNLFSALSVFETNVLLLLKILQEHNTTVSKHKPGQGIADLLKATAAYGAKPHSLKYYEQVCVAISIRNCLMHANGLLTAFRKAGDLEAQIRQRKFIFFESTTRRPEQERSPGNDEVTIESSELGDQLVITNNYSHTVCSYLQEYFCDLCGTLNPITSLRPIAYEIDPRELIHESRNP